MSLKSERNVETAVAATSRSLKKRFQDKLKTGVSIVALGIATLGIPQQMHAQAPQQNVVEVHINDLPAYLASRKGQSNQQQYAAVYANRDNYRAQRVAEAAYGSPQWLAQNGYEYDVGLSARVNRAKYLGAFLNYNERPDSYGRPKVTYLARDPVHGKSLTVTMENAIQMAQHPGGDTMGIYTGRDEINNPGNNGYYGGGYYPSRGERVVRNVVHTLGAIDHTIHVIRGR